MQHGPLFLHVQQDARDAHLAGRAAHDNWFTLSVAGERGFHIHLFAAAQLVVDFRVGHGTHARFAAAAGSYLHICTGEVCQCLLIHAGSLDLVHAAPFRMAGCVVEELAALREARGGNALHKQLHHILVDKPSLEGFRQVVFFQPFAAGAAGGDDVGDVKPLRGGFFQQAGHGGEVGFAIFAVQGIFACCQQGIAAALVFFRHDHGKARPEHEHQTGKADIAVEQRAAAAGEVEHRFQRLCVCAGFGDEDGPLVQPDGFRKAVVADLRPGAGKERIIQPGPP